MASTVILSARSAEDCCCHRKVCVFVCVRMHMRMTAFNLPTDVSPLLCVSTLLTLSSQLLYFCPSIANIIRQACGYKAYSVSHSTP